MASDLRESLPKMEALGDKILQIDSFCDASNTFEMRINNTGALKGCQIKTPAWEFGKVPPPSLMDESPDTYGDGCNITMSTWDGECSRENWWWTNEQDLGLEELFQESGNWEDCYEGILDLFDETQINQPDLIQHLIKKRSNQLYPIFKGSGTQTTPIKRKWSPEGRDSHENKVRRMSYDQTASPSLRPEKAINHIPRERASTVSSPTVIRREKRKAPRKLIPGQKLITGIWGPTNPSKSKQLNL